MVDGVLLSISIIIGIAAILTIISKFIRQPPIIAYLVAGIVVGPLFFNLIGSNNTDLIQILAHIGVAFLLFIVGLSLDLKVLKEVGKVSILAGFIEVFLTSSVAFLIAIGLGFSNFTALYLGIGLAFSSTVVVVKILSDKREIDTLHGKIALGILIVEDFIAALVLMAVPIIKDQSSYFMIAQGLFFAVLVVVAIFIIAWMLSRFLNYLATSSETLFLFGIAWALIISVVFDALGFSLEIGALIAGMSLASSKYNLELSGKIKPLRDFFVVLFFVFFGSQLAGEISSKLIIQASIFSLFIFLGKPIIVMSVLRMLGYKKRTNFLAGASLAQISEFSLIIVLLGFNLGLLSREILSLVIITALITIGLSSYSIHYSTFIFNKVSRVLGIFEKKNYLKKDNKDNFDVVLFGYHRIGYKILNELKKLKIPFIVVDYNPKVILDLCKQGINCVYGDASDEEFLNEIGIKNTKLVISTIPDLDANLMIKEKLNKFNKEAIFLATTENPRNAPGLYEKGVDYVLIPHHLGGNYAATMIENFMFNKKKYIEEGKRHQVELGKAKDSSAFSY